MSNQNDQYGTKKNFHTLQEGEYYRQRNGAVIVFDADKVLDGNYQPDGTFNCSCRDWDFVEHVLVTPAEAQRQTVKMRVGGVYRDAAGDVRLCGRYDASTGLYSAYGAKFHEDGTPYTCGHAVLVEEIK